MKKIDLSIIIVTYNSQKFVKNCFDSIYKYCSDISFEIIVVDNNSDDETVNLIKSNYHKIKLIESKVNLGFAKGSNEGVKISKGENILLLNNDTILLNNISVALKTLRADDNIGALGIKMLNEHKNYICSVGKFPKAYELIKFSWFNEKSKEFLSGEFKNQEVSIQVDWLTGAFLMIRKEFWDKVKGLDEDYFLYVEDVDICKKLNLLGKQNVFLPSLSFIHYVGFNHSREHLLINGYKIYANKFFNGHHKIIAKTCLKINHEYKKFKQSFY